MLYTLRCRTNYAIDKPKRIQLSEKVQEGIKKTFDLDESEGGNFLKFTREYHSQEYKRIKSRNSYTVYYTLR